MTLATDIANDYALFDGVETVSVTPANRASATPITGVSALREPLRTSDYFGGAALGVSSRDVAMSLWSSTLSGNVPLPGWKITDTGSVVYTILSVSKDTLGTRYRCICRTEEA